MPRVKRGVTARARHQPHVSGARGQRGLERLHRLLHRQLALQRLARLHAHLLGDHLGGHARPAARPDALKGWFWGALSGYTSFMAHAGGPPINAYAIPLKLPPLVFTATMAVFFFAVNLSKWLPYAWLGLLDVRNMATSMALVPLAPLGVWVGVRIAHRINPLLFYRLIYLGMLLTGLKLVWDGFLAR